MSYEIKLPKISDDVDTATVAEVLVSEGDKVEKSQAVIVVDSDKATLDVPSEEEGIVESIKVKVDDEIKVGDVIITLKSDSDDMSDKGGDNGEDKNLTDEETEEDKESEADLDAADEKDKDDNAKQEEENSSKQNEEESEKKEEKKSARDEDDQGDEMKAKDENEEKDQVEEETEKGKADTKEEPQDNEKDEEDKSAKEQKKDTAEGEDDEEANKSENTEKDKSEEHEQKEDILKNTSNEDNVSAAPNVWRLARELGVELEHVKGSGRQGRIMEQDVKNHARNLIEEKDQETVSASSSSAPDFSKWGDTIESSLKGIRKATAKNTLKSWSSIPHVTHFDEAEISEIEDLIENKKHLAEEQDASLTITAVLMKILAEALQEFPMINAGIDMNKELIIKKKYIHIGVAVDTDDGLLVPVIRDVNEKDIIQLSVELTKMSKKAREGNLSPDEMKGASFTISNVGGIGGTNFTPIIPFGQAAILGVSKATHKPVWENGDFQPKLMLPLALSYDHRLIDGADAARFTKWICEVIENPLNLLLE